MKKTSKTHKHAASYEIKLPGGWITPGPGTVPTSGASVSHTSVKDMVSKLRKASKDKLFEDKEEEVDYGILRPHTS